MNTNTSSQYISNSIDRITQLSEYELEHLILKINTFIEEEPNNEAAQKAKIIAETEYCNRLKK